MECHASINLDYGAFSEAMQTRASRDRIPIAGSFELTHGCNVRCVHCYLPMTRRQGKRRHELSFAEVDRILGEVADAGCLWLLLTGGEPLSRPDFKEIYSSARKRGLILTLFTNGTLIDARMADFLADWRPFSIEISLYGATRETYEQVTGVPGSYERCMRGIDLLLERKLPLKLKSVVLSINQHELAAMQSFTESRGLEFRFDPVVIAGIDGSSQPIQYRLSPEQVITLEANDPHRAQAWPGLIEDYQRYEIVNNRMYNCGAGKTSFHIDSEGKLCLCILERNPAFDLRQGSFHEGWKRFIPKLLELEYGPNFECTGCDLRMICPQCPAVGAQEMGDPGRRSPFVCELTHLRYSAFAQG